MANTETIDPKIERELKWQELTLRVDHYKYYMTAALQTSAFFYAITGAVLGYYLRNSYQPAEAHLEYFLLLPILLGSVLGGIFLHGAKLQAKAVENIDDVRDELRNRFGFIVKRIHDAHLLVIFLRIFGNIFFLVAAALLIIPLLLARVTLSTSPLTRTQLFYLVAVIIMICGRLLPVYACWEGKRLKAQRDENWQETIKDARKWLESEVNQPFNILKFKKKYFYYELLPYLSEQTVNSIRENNEKVAKILLLQDIEKFQLEADQKQEECEKTNWERIKNCLMFRRQTDSETAANGETGQTLENHSETSTSADESAN